VTAGAAATGWRAALPAGVRAYLEPAPLAAFFLGVSSGAPYAMIAATLTTRLAQDGIRKSTVTAFTLTFLVYNLKFLWAWWLMVCGCRCWAGWVSVCRGCCWLV
jgi:PAT family beta-lactamase induction signal transducer AmpG